MSQGGGRTPGGWHSMGLTCASRVASRAVSSPTRLQFRHPVGRKAAGGTGPLGGGHPPLFAHANAAGLGRDPPEKAVGRREGRRGAVLGRPASRRVTKVGASAERRGGGQEGRTPPPSQCITSGGGPSRARGLGKSAVPHPKMGGGACRVSCCFCPILALGEPQSPKPTRGRKADSPKPTHSSKPDPP